MRPPTRKSTAPMWEPSSAPSKLSESGGNPRPSSLTGRPGLRLERQLHRTQFAAEWIEHQAESLQGRGAEQGIVAWLSDDDHGIASSIVVLECGGGQPSRDDPAVREDELAGRMA